MNICMFMCVCVCMCGYVCMYMYIYVYVYVYVCMCVYVCIGIYGYEDKGFTGTSVHKFLIFIEESFSFEICVINKDPIFEFLHSSEASKLKNKNICIKRVDT